jgi:hypothetical protein
MSMKGRKKRPRKDVLDDLYLSVQQYIEHYGGKVVVIGDIEIQEWIKDGKYVFRLAIKCLGKKPVFKKGN